jgi:hypothetical protein
LSATLGLYLLHVVGLRGDWLAANGTWAAGILSASGIRHMLDLLVTGLAIGGGTKPLHDPISKLQAAKASKKDPRWLVLSRVSMTQDTRQAQQRSNDPLSLFASRRHVTRGGDRAAGHCPCHLARVRRPLPAAPVLSRTV